MLRKIDDTRLLRYLSWFSAIALAPLPFLAGYYSHHDGLILANARILRESLNNGGPWPFNQYGSFGILPQTFFSFLFPIDYQLVSLRLFTLICYWSTGYLLFKLSNVFTTQNNSYLVVIIYFVSQPFNGSNFLPWASSFLMPIVIAHTYLFASTINNQKIVHGGIQAKILFAGFLLPMILLSRAQIGVLIFFIASIFAFLVSQIRGLISYLLGILLFCIPFSIFMTIHGWFSASLSDEFIFGSVYLKYEDVSHIPIPTFSFLGSMGFFFILQYGNQIWKYLGKRWSSRQIFGLFTLFSILIFLTIFTILRSRGLNLNAAYFNVLGRFWISLYLGCLFYFFVHITKSNCIALKEKDFTSRKLHLENFLFLISFAAQFQIWPFFDSMHFWWGSVPAALIVILVVREKFLILNLSFTTQQRTKILASVIVLVLAIIPLGTQIHTPRNALNLYGTSGTYINSSDALLNFRTRIFLEENVDSGSRVLNLCQNPDVFLTSAKIQSATRYFVFWPHMRHVRSIQDAFENSNPDTVVTCTLNEFNTDTQAQSEKQQKSLLEKVAPKRTLRAELSIGKLWQIWTVN